MVCANSNDFLIFLILFLSIYLFHSAVVSILLKQKIGVYKSSTLSNNNETIKTNIKQILFFSFSDIDRCKVRYLETEISSE